jgi:hypothetical protein
LLLGERESFSVSDRMIFSTWRGRVSVRTQQYRLDHQGKLFDMVEDPGQYDDISKQKAETATRLRDAAQRWREDVLGQGEVPERPFPIGHPDVRLTQMPARDAQAHGGIERSNRFPNCSFFRNWTSTDDKLTWDAEVLADGVYEVEIYYACPAADVGSTIELSFNDARLVGRIEHAHDPPLRGGEHDRVARAESYVKDFRALPLGEIALEQGRGELTLRALEIPGSQAMEFRLMMFTRK